MTIETQKGHNYLRCTKWKTTCSQRYTREEKITGDITAALRLVAVPPDWTDWLFIQVEKEATGVGEAGAVRIIELEKDINTIETRLDRLMTAYTDDVLDLASYSQARKKLLVEKRDCEQKLAEVNEAPETIFEPHKNFIEGLKQATILAESGTDEEKRDFFKKVASNPNVFNREVRFTPRGAWKLVIPQGSIAHHGTASAIADAVPHGKSNHVDVKRRGGDSNSGTHQKTLIAAKYKGSELNFCPSFCPRKTGDFPQRKRKDSNLRYPFGQTGFRNRRIQPLCHASD